MRSPPFSLTYLRGNDARDRQLLGEAAEHAADFIDAAPQLLFTIHDAGISRFDTGFDVTPDDRGFIVTRDIEDIDRATLTLVTNWIAEFEK